MAISVFISTVSDEFRFYRDQLSHDLTRKNVSVKVQEDFKGLGGYTLDTLDAYIADCDAVVHLVGDMCGAPAGETQQRALLARYPDLTLRLPSLSQALKTGVAVSYTHWEAWLALYLGKQLYIAKAAQTEQRGSNYKPTEESRAAQAAHLARLREAKVYPFEFTSPDNLAKQVLASGILDLLVVDELARQGKVRQAADAGIETSVIASLAARLKPAQKLDLAEAVVEVSHAVDIAIDVAKGAATGSSDGLVDEVLKRIAAKTKANDPEGATREAEDGLARWEKQEVERRVNATATGVALLEAALKTDLLRFDTGAAAARVEKIAWLQHDEDPKALFKAIRGQLKKFQAEGRNDGLNFSLAVAIAIARREVALAHGPDQQGMALNDLGVALEELGERESGVEKLKEAVAAYRAALKKRTRDRVPLDWAMTQNNLGNALAVLGERESGTARLEEAAEAYRAALQEYTREREPLLWATTQNNLGVALMRLGERESGTAQLEEAVAAYRAALEERTRERVPLDWATTQVNLGAALQALGERGSVTARLEEAVEAYRAALQEYTRERKPLLWATAQGNLGNVLVGLGKRESGTDKLREAVSTYRAALEELTRERVPLDWAAMQSNLGDALQALGERESGTQRVEEAVEAYRAALQECTRERVPRRWAMMQNNLGNALFRLGERESGTARLEEATEAYRAALTGLKPAADSFGHEFPQHNLDLANGLLAQRRGGDRVSADPDCV
jgi:tetratricopeptide (TPR) repeat protein